ncbi:tRNA (N(6)-L-threonylcarbamoyladenosine(37)-C(2))-methylthiotransferase MtaB, partial [candidate division KSB1 bacterium]
MKNVAFYTLGCKLNQAETAILSKQFSDAGYGIVSVNENPDVIIINTCTVTERSAAKSRKTARKLARENPDSIIILTGCYPQVSSEEAKSIAGVDYIFGTDEKLD